MKHKPRPSLRCSFCEGPAAVTYSDWLVLTWHCTADHHYGVVITATWWNRRWPIRWLMNHYGWWVMRRENRRWHMND